jgi:NAD(P)-dependent dehydrogenase (short-subunit alcohol dehydrogenase family)
VVAHYHRQAAPVAALRERFGPDRVVPVAADLATEEGCIATVAAAERLDVLVHSAGIWNAGPIRELEREALETMFRTNTFSAYYAPRRHCGAWSSRSPRSWRR